MQLQKAGAWSGPPTPGKSQVGIGFFYRDTGTEPFEKQLDLWANGEGPGVSVYNLIRGYTNFCHFKP